MNLLKNIAYLGLTLTFTPLCLVAMDDTNLPGMVWQESEIDIQKNTPARTLSPSFGRALSPSSEQFSSAREDSSSLNRIAATSIMSNSSKVLKASKKQLALQDSNTHADMQKDSHSPKKKRAKSPQKIKAKQVASNSPNDEFEDLYPQGLEDIFRKELNRAELYLDDQRPDKRPQPQLTNPQVHIHNTIYVNNQTSVYMNGTTYKVTKNNSYCSGCSIQ